MKKLFLFSTMMLVSLMIACATVTSVFGQYDFNAFSGSSIEDGAIDGTIGSEWDDAGNYTNVAISPQGTAEIWTKQDGTNLYIAVRFTADSNNPWISFLFGGTACMQSGADGALFGHDEHAADGYRDISFNGFTDISEDASQDGTGAMIIDSSNLVTVELRKPLNSGDSNGRDIAWAEGNSYALIIMWNSDLHGASGGSVIHSEGTLTDRTIFINPDAIPELPGLIFAALLLAMAISAFLFRKRITTGPTTNTVH